MSCIVLRNLPFFFALVLLLAACGREEAPKSSDPAGDLEPGTPSFGVYNTLKATDNQVRVAGEASRPFIPVKGHELDVNGSSVEMYEFATREDADAVAAKIAPDGSVPGQPQWPAGPHFHRTDKIIVLYVGDNPSIEGALNLAIGPQFAGH